MNEFRTLLMTFSLRTRGPLDVIRKLMERMKKGEAELRPIQPNDAIDDLLTIIHSELLIEHISLSIQKETDLPEIGADRVQLQQVLLNLVLNAVDAMQDATKKCLRISTAKNGRDRIVICIADSGIGVDPNRAGSLFEPFVTTKTDGLGMGLSIAKRIIEAHGGAIWIDAGKEEALASL